VSSFWTTCGGHIVFVAWGFRASIWVGPALLIPMDFVKPFLNARSNAFHCILFHFPPSWHPACMRKQSTYRASCLPPDSFRTLSMIPEYIASSSPASFDEGAIGRILVVMNMDERGIFMVVMAVAMASPIASSFSWFWAVSMRR